MARAMEKGSSTGRAMTKASRKYAEGSIDFRDKQAIVELAVATMGCHTAVISTIVDGVHTVFASEGDGFQKLEDTYRLVSQVIESGQTICVGGNDQDKPLYVGLPLHIDGSRLAGVLSIIDLKRKCLSKADKHVLRNLQAIVNSLLGTHDAHRLAAEREAELQITLENMDQGITVFDADARLTLWNQRYIDIFDIDPELVKEGASLRDLVGSKQLSNGFEGFDTDDYDKMLGKLRDGLARGEVVEGGVRLNNGRIISSIHAAMPNGGWVATHSDITERVLAQEKVEHASLHDGMTGLVNRSRFTEEFERLNEGNGRLAVMLIDIDHFKAVNDNHGHGAGDAVIMSVAERLRSCVRKSDVVARLGGDEFAVLLSLDKDTGVNTARAVAGKVVERMREQLRFKNSIIKFSVSVGCHEALAGQTSLEKMLSRADFALYKAKEKGRSRYQFFDPSIASELERSKRMQALVDQDTYADTLTVHFQPIVCLKTEKDCCFETLIRWAGNEAEYMTPSDIIQAAEQNGSIHSLGNWVLNEAIKAHSAWPGSTRIAVNISPKQLGSGDLLEHVKAALQRWKLAPNRLELEVTETAVLQDNASINELQQIKDLGVQIALDDFGTGYSSLTLLQRFPFDKLKIDRSFVDQVDSDPLSHAIVSSIADLGRKLSVETVAEGIETDQHLSVMEALGCGMGQGFLLGRPMNAGAIAYRMQQMKKAA